MVSFFEIRDKILMLGGDPESIVLTGVFGMAENGAAFSQQLAEALGLPCRVL